jgi:hypothetical protein
MPTIIITIASNRPDVPVSVMPPNPVVVIVATGAAPLPRCQQLRGRPGFSSVPQVTVENRLSVQAVAVWLMVNAIGCHVSCNNAQPMFHISDNVAGT